MLKYLKFNENSRATKRIHQLKFLFVSEMHAVQLFLYIFNDPFCRLNALYESSL